MISERWRSLLMRNGDRMAQADVCVWRSLLSEDITPALQVGADLAKLSIEWKLEAGDF